MFIGGFNMVGSYIAGILGAKYQKKTLLSLLYIARAVAIVVLLLFPKSDLLILAFAAIMGLGWLSTVPLTQGMVGYFFGPRYMATLFGFVFFSHQLGALIGSYLGGYLREFQGDYVTMWWINVALGVFAALIHLPIREQPVARLQRDMAAS
jgi:MFS family permease